MKLIELLDEYGIGKVQTEYNQWHSRPVEYEFNVNNAEKFNTIYRALLASDLDTIKRTKSGAVAMGKRAMYNSYAWDCLKTNTGVRLTVIIMGKMYVFKIGAVGKRAHETGVSPSSAWCEFRKMCTADGIDLEKYAVSPAEGRKIKETIPDPYIEMKIISEINDPGLENVHHIDFHSSYPAGLVNTHPEFRNVVETLYNKRGASAEDKAKYKQILNYSIGCMQSNKHMWQARWAQLGKDAICDNIKRLKQVAMMLVLTGRKIVGYNTDGIWYQGEIYHGNDEGTELGQWSNDYYNCRFRAKSDGAYEFIGYDTSTGSVHYKAVVRGTTKYDTVVERDKWQWGDIYRDDADAIKWSWDDELGVILNDKRN